MILNFVIRFFNSKTLQRGYVFKSEKGVMCGNAVNGQAINRFDTVALAKAFIRENKLKRKYCTCTILPETDLLKDPDYPSAPVNKTMFYIANPAGERLFYSPKTNTYHFANCEIGYAAWDKVENAQKFIDSVTFNHPVEIKEISPETSNSTPAVKTPTTYQV